jgi:transcriptional regulator with XRE-family HTH domain
MELGIKIKRLRLQNNLTQEELADRVSDVHAAAVTQRIKLLNCPTRQKLELLDAVIKTVKERSREQT